MKRIVSLSIAVFLFLVAVEASTKQFYYRESAPATLDWEPVSRAPKGAVVTLHVALKQRNLEKMLALLEADSDPDSPVFGRHKTREEILALVAPPRSVQLKVENWIHRIASRHPRGHVKVQNLGDAIKVSGSVAFVEELFETELHVFENTNGEQMIKHLGALNLPVEIFHFVEMVTGITEFPPASVLRKPESKAPLQNANNQCNVPFTIKKLYSIPDDLFVNAKTNVTIFSSSVGGAPGAEGFGEPDLLQYQTANGLSKNPISCIIGDTASYYTPNVTDEEAQLDVQAATTIAPNVHTCFYLTNFWMYEFTQFLLSNGTPGVVSMSYAWFERDECNITGNCQSLNFPNSTTYVYRSNMEFAKLSLNGFTLVAASGDDGVAGTHQSDDSCALLGPLFPASSPYVLSVGATSIESSSESNPLKGAPAICTDSQYNCVCSISTNEQIASQSNTAGFDTGGGFSEYTTQPKWQTAAVQAYLASGVPLPPSNLFNPNNRAYPDIGAVGENFCVITLNQGCSGIGGTSVSAPLISGMIAILNHDRIHAGKGPLGLFGPIVYKMYDLNKDLYFRSNYTVQINPGECPSNYGYSSNPNGGWNPLVGVGSPHFDQIRKYVATLN